MFILPDLPFDSTALQPHMSGETVSVHHSGHHRAYVEKLNELIEGTRFADMTLEAIITATRGQASEIERKIFQNAAQHYNHSLFWQSLSPSGEAPGDGLRAALERDFGSIESFRDKFRQRGEEHFASGWLWLVTRNGTLALVTTHDAETPLGAPDQPLLCCDLWEHAYYLDHQNKRADYLDTFITKLVDWAFVEQRLENALSASVTSGSTVAPDPRAQFQSPERLFAHAELDDAEKLALFEQWHLDLDNRLKAEEEGMSASDPMSYRKESRLADEAARVQRCMTELSDRVKQEQS